MKRVGWGHLTKLVTVHLARVGTYFNFNLSLDEHNKSKGSRSKGFVEKASNKLELEPSCRKC